MTVDLNLTLGERQFFARSHHDLGLDDVNAGDPLCDRVLNLHAGVHLDEIELAVFVQELERARAAVADLLDGRHAALADLFDELARNARCRRFFDDFLVTPLHGAVALAQPDRILVLVGHDLNLDVARVLQVLFHVDRRVAERGTGFGLGGLHRMNQRRFGVHHAHAAPAAAARRLDDHRVADGLGRALDDDRVIGQSAFRAGHARHAGLDHGLLGRDLVAHDADRLGTRSDEFEAAFLDPLGKVGVFAQETVTGVDGFGVGHLGGGNDGRHVEVALRRRSGADTDRLVGQFDVFGLAVSLGIHHHGLDAEFTAGALDTQGNFAPVGNQDLFEHGAGVTRWSTGSVRTPRPARFRTGWR